MLVQNILVKENPLPLYGECGCCNNLGRIDESFCMGCQGASLYQLDKKKYPVEYKVFWAKERGLIHYSPEQSEIKIGKCYINISNGRPRFQIYKIRETDHFTSGIGAFDIFLPFLQTPALYYDLAEIGKCYVNYKDEHGNSKVSCFEEDVEQAIHFAELVNGKLQIHLGRY